jgi:hypothetical protein
LEKNGLPAEPVSSCDADSPQFASAAAATSPKAAAQSMTDLGECGVLSVRK